MSSVCYHPPNTHTLWTFPIKANALSLALVFLLNLQISAAFAGNTDSLQRYHSGIDRVDREIIAAKEHRTAIITRMEDIANQLDAITSESVKVDDNQPSISAAIADAEAQITSMGKKISDVRNAIRFIEVQLAAIPTPSLWQDALGNSANQHRQIAVKKYQLHKTKNRLNDFVDREQALLVSRNSLFASKDDVQESIDALNAEQQRLVEKRKYLEAQFTDLTATIVEKQDRHSQLQQRLENLRKDPRMAQITSMRGQLTDPTSGTLRHRYAEPKTRGLLKWDGIVVNAPMGQEISTVFDGTVVFADHMQGLGNVAIIDHGEGYMSLYGMTDFLIVEAGQDVIAGDIIGTVGTGDNGGDPGLYFEIRHNAATIDPTKWLNLQRISQ